MKQEKTKYAVEQVVRTVGMCRLAKRSGISRSTLWRGIKDPGHASPKTRRALRKAGLWPDDGKAVAE